MYVTFYIQIHYSTVYVNSFMINQEFCTDEHRHGIYIVSNDGWENNVWSFFKVSTGLIQGDSLSPILFNLALEKVIREM